MLMITRGTGKHVVHLEKLKVGKDLLLIVRGGEQPHIGSVVLCEPDKSVEIIRVGTHKDHIVLRPLVKKACEKYNTTIVAVGGIHIDNATKKDIDLVIQNCKELESCI